MNVKLPNREKNLPPTSNDYPDKQLLPTSSIPRQESPPDKEFPPTSV